MSSKYKFKHPDGLYFITCTVINWADVFTRNSYRDLMIERPLARVFRLVPF